MNRTACAVDEGELWDLVDATEESRDQHLAAHVEACASCRERLANIRRLHAGLESLEADTPPELPQDIGGYRILRILGEGGMGVVYEAEQPNPKRRVALKVMRPIGAASERRLHAFRREIQALGRLNHESIARVYDAGRAQDGQLFLVMELVRGRLLSEFVGPCRSTPVRAVAELMARLAEAVHHAHQRGVIHRDLKPANILVDDNDLPHVLDFGLARFLQSDYEAAISQSFGGSPLGTLPYMSPEQLAGDREAQDVRTDVYSLGVMLYELLTEKLPHGNPTGVNEHLKSVTEDQPPHPSALRKHVPTELGDVVLKAIAPDREQRYASAAALADDLRRFLDGEAVTARPPSLLYRLRVLSRRHKIAVAVAIALAILPFAYVERGLASGRERSQAARAALAKARVLLERHEHLVNEHTQAEAELDLLEERMQHEYFTPEEELRLEEIGRLGRDTRLDRTRLVRDIESLVQRASLDQALEAECRRVRGDLYLNQAIEVRASLSRFSRSWPLWWDHYQQERLLREQSRKTFASNPRLVDAELAFNYDLTTEPPGAEVHLFRFEELASLVPGGEPRVVPVPIAYEGIPSLCPPGSPALSVDKAVAPLQVGDLIVAIDGRSVRYLPDLGRAMAEAGEREATIARSELCQTVRLPRGLEVSPTATPLATSPESFTGVTPWIIEALGNQNYLILIRHPDFEDVRLILTAERTYGSRLLVRRNRYPSGSTSWDLTLTPRGSGPEGYVLVTPLQGRKLESYWMQRHEATCGQYLEFLNDPDTQRELAESNSDVRLVPRNPANAARGGSWPRDAAGLFHLPADRTPGHPVLGVSWHDAQAFAQWKTRRAGEAGKAWKFSLPTRLEWTQAVAAPSYFVWGNQFRPKWVSSCFANPTPRVEPVMSYPIDQTPTGIYDVSGSAAEWLDHWLSEEQNHRWIVWGSWAQADASFFNPLEPKGREPEEADDAFGFRLVAREL